MKLTKHKPPCLPPYQGDSKKTASNRTPSQPSSVLPYQMYNEWKVSQSVDKFRPSIQPFRVRDEKSASPYCHPTDKKTFKEESPLTIPAASRNYPLIRGKKRGF